MTRCLVRFVPVVLILGVTAAFAQTGARAQDATLQAAIEARQKAIDSANATEWAKYTTDDYVQVTADGVITSRKERMQAVAATTPSPKPVTGPIDSVRMFGPDTAVVIQRNTSNQRISLVWVKQAGAWKVASAQNTPITKK